MSNPKKKKSKPKHGGRRLAEDSGPIRQAIGQRLRQLADEMGGAAALAGVLGIGVSTLHRWLTGGSVPTADHLVNIAAQTDASLEWLVAGIGPRHRRDLMQWDRDRGQVLPIAPHDASETATPETSVAHLQATPIPPLTSETRRPGRFQNADGIRASLLAWQAEICRLGSRPALDLVQAPTLIELAEFLHDAARQLEATAAELPPQKPK